MTQTWFITGAGRCIGREITLSALLAGNNVVATGRAPTRVEAALAETDAGDRVLVLLLDVTDNEQAIAAVVAAIERFKHIDVLVNSADYGLLGHFETIETDAIAEQYDTNVFGNFNVTRAVLPVTRSQRSGHIFNLSSIGGVVGFSGAAVYTSTKFAIEGFSENLAIGLASFGIRVTIVEPGFSRTDFLDRQSVRYGDVQITDYADAAKEQRAHYDDRIRKQPGDPRKLGEALVNIVASEDPPLRYAAGSDAAHMTREMLEKRLGERDR